MTVRFKIINNMGTAVRVRLVHFEATFVADIAKDQEYLSSPNEPLLAGERAVVVFDNPTGAILLLDQKSITADVTITLGLSAVTYGSY